MDGARRRICFCWSLVMCFMDGGVGVNGLSPRKVYVVIPPCSTMFMDLFSGQDVLCQYMKELDSISNVTVVNMLGDKRFSQDDFVDTTHLNIEGAYKFTTLLVELMDIK